MFEKIQITFGFLLTYSYLCGQITKLKRYEETSINYIHAHIGFCCGMG